VGAGPGGAVGGPLGGPAGGPGPGGLAGIGDRIPVAPGEPVGLGGVLGHSAPGGGFPPPPEGYQTRVDVDGDGRWDAHVLRGRADGGVDILVDSDRDGRVDFVGHDRDADGLVDSAAYDRDGDGHVEQRTYDDDGDGWQDRTVRTPVPQPPDGGPGRVYRSRG
ncbi:MAG TPA: hypothetical protein VNV66_03975, partial [Pilimelia sp.]|nr:hypothetical protein [Pilimelia sp.]